MTPDFLRATRGGANSWWISIVDFIFRKRGSFYHGVPTSTTTSASSSNNNSSGAQNSAVLKQTLFKCFANRLVLALLIGPVILFPRKDQESPLAKTSSEVPLWKAAINSIYDHRRSSGLGHPRAFPYKVPNRTGSCTEKDPCHFVLVADLDETNNPKQHYKSFFLPGKLFFSSTGKPVVEFAQPPVKLRGALNEGGRGLELSEVILFKGHLYSFDDRTGAVYEYSQNGNLVPRSIITEGDGETGKGFKIEWATEKDGLLWVGSFGKEYTDRVGEQILSEANFWVVLIDENGTIVERKNWKPVYQILRDTVGTPWPGYLLHEAVNWSPILKKWIFLPRRVSVERYNEKDDERKGSNLMLLASEDFTNIEIKKIGKVIPERGFSSFKFIPGTNDSLIIAIKSLEDSNEEKQQTFMTVFSSETGEVVMDDIEIPHQVKYEGLEFVPKNAPFPFMLNFDGERVPTKLQQSQPLSTTGWRED